MLFLQDVNVMEKVSEKMPCIKGSMVAKKDQQILLKNVCPGMRVLQGDEVLEFVGVFVNRSC